MFVAILVVGCKPKTEPVEQKAPSTMQVGDTVFAGIGVVGGTDSNAQSRITQVLKEHEIEVLMEGSGVYGIWVPEEHVEKAEAILQKDSTEKNYSIKLQR